MRSRGVRRPRARHLAVAGLLLVSGGCASAGRHEPPPAGQHPQELARRTAEEARGRYLLFLPEGYGEDGRRWPLLLFLHGAGERGDDLERVKVHGPPRIVQSRPDFPFVVVSPQVPENRIWSTRFLDALLNEVVERHAVDPDRIYVTGLSMGGYGTWDLAMEFPDRFAAIAPVSGGGVPSGACALRHLPVWAFHGAKDEIVPVERTGTIVERLRQCGGEPRFTVYPDAGHDAWTRTYEDPALYEWLLGHRRRTGAGAAP